MFLSAVWTLILTAPIHPMNYWCNAKFSKSAPIKNKVIYTLSECILSKLNFFVNLFDFICLQFCSFATVLKSHRFSRSWFLFTHLLFLKWNHSILKGQEVCSVHSGVCPEATVMWEREKERERVERSDNDRVLSVVHSKRRSGGQIWVCV